MYRKLAVAVALGVLLAGSAAYGWDWNSQDKCESRIIKRHVGLRYDSPGNDKFNPYDSPGDDTLRDSPGNDRLYDSPGDDTFYDSPGDDTLWDSPGDDMFEALWLDLMMGW
jgi:hypothetical protein